MNRAALIGSAVLILIIGAFAQSKKLAFEIVAMADGEDGKATEAGFQSPGWSHLHCGFSTYKASDGQRFSAKYCELRNEDEAHHCFEWSLQRATQVSEQGDKRNMKGKTVGRRAEIVPASGREKCAVLWTDGAMLREIVADDCAHARALENQYH